MILGKIEKVVSTPIQVLTHAIGDQEQTEIDESYADNIGHNLSKFANSVLDSNGYNYGMATFNSHVGNAASTAGSSEQCSFIAPY